MALICQDYACKEDAENGKVFGKKLKYHTLEFNVKETQHYSGKGRPKKGQQPKEIKYKVEATVQRDQESIDQQLLRKVDLYWQPMMLNHSVLRPMKCYVTTKSNRELKVALPL